MTKKIIGLFIFLLTLIFPINCFAKSNSFVSIVNPIRGADFWEENQPVEKALLGEIEALKENDLPATFLLRFDALSEQKIIDLLKNSSNYEKGIFLEVTHSWAKKASVSYYTSDSWHNAGSAFLSGYEQDERRRLIETVFEEFKRIFGDYPKSVGAWWIDSFSLSLMQQKYGITSALIVSDQYTTDNYQIWGQFWSTPYYPSKNNVLHPAQKIESKLPVVITQWAARDPVNGYGNGVMESTLSVQANDYLDYHNLTTNYFSKLVDIYTNQDLNKFGHLVVGLENSYSWDKYSQEYKNQMKVLSNLRKNGQFSIVNLEDFSSWYQKTFPQLSSEHIIVADDPLGTFKKVVWFMNPYYRAGWFFNQDGSVFRDVRQYIDGEEELCFQKRCDQVNFATFATRVLDEVSFGHKWVIDQGKIQDFKLTKNGNEYIISYTNEAGRERRIEFLERDIRVDNKISSIDGIILDATKHQLDSKKDQKILGKGMFSWSILSVFLKVINFLGFLFVGCVVPGLLIINKILSKETSFLKKANIGLILGLVIVTLLFYLGNLVNLKIIIFAYLIVNLILLIKFRKNLFSSLLINFKDKFNFLVVALIGIGTIFQQMPTFKNGLNYPYGLGFWGPNTHDGIWHVSLINQLVKDVPPQNPIFAGEILKNYHYFYDLLIAATSYISAVPILDLTFRFYPLIFSLSLGIGSYFLIKSFVKEESKEGKLAILLSLYLVYFAGSFGWIVEYIKQGHLGGESAFWANQSISFNLNPPSAISLIIVIAIISTLPNIKSKLSILVLTILSGALISFKAYAAILILLSFLMVGVIKRSPLYLLVFITATFFASILFLSNFTTDKKLILFSPFWLIHTMIDSPDRVGWARLSLARTVGLETGNWFKFFSAEVISLIIFILGNLGTRLFALLSLIKIKEILKNLQYLFIFLFSTLALIIPILFIQSGNPWNTIQFIYYFIYISAILGGYVFAKIILKLPKILALLLATIFICLTPINSWATANGYLSYQPHSHISNEEFKALKFLKNQKEGVVLTHPYDPRIKNMLAEPWPQLAYDSTAYVSALSGKSVFIEDEPQNQILLTDYKKRITQAKDFFEGSHIGGSEFLRDNNIRYIYLPRIFKISLDTNKLNLNQIYGNDEILIYQLN